MLICCFLIVYMVWFFLKTINEGITLRYLNVLSEIFELATLYVPLLLILEYSASVSGSDKMDVMSSPNLDLLCI